MATLEIPNLPDELYREIEKLARVRGTTIAAVARDMLAKGMGGPDSREEKLLSDIRAEREAMARRGVNATEQEIREARDQGRK